MITGGRPRERRRGAPAAVTSTVSLPVVLDGSSCPALAEGVRADGEDFLFVHTKVVPEVPLVRIHSGCVTGDVFGSQRCDCGPQLTASWHAIAREGGGVLYAPAQEGRGIGLFNKIVAYGLQEQGADTFEANRELGFEDDLRDFSGDANALKALGIERVRLLTNNPSKRQQLERHGVAVLEVVPIVAGVSAHNLAYLTAKRDQHGHQFDALVAVDPSERGAR